jgi:thiamine pyrophosphate-dependent acetolactate synthase large subunit-like protein
MDMLRLLDIEYLTLLPGSTFGGIHDSAVNYTGNSRPELILCTHEMNTVSMARGYARVTGRPMAAIVHNVVGLLNASMTIYDAWCDRVPVLILGGAGPVNAANRKPWIHWIHSANVQGSLVRDFTKWNDQPASVAAIPESLLQAYRIAVTEPAGPVYVSFDADLQEQAVEQPFELPAVGRYRAAAGPEPDRHSLREAAQLIVQADLPLVFADRVGRSADAVRSLVELADLLALPVINIGGRHSFPTPHPLDFAGAQQSLLREADVVLALDVFDLFGALRLVPDANSPTPGPTGGPQPKVISISLEELLHSNLMADSQALAAVDVPMLADTRLALPYLVEECKSLLDASARARVDRRRQVLEERQQRLRAQQQQYLAEQWAHPQITEARLVAELWEAVKDEDFVITHGRIRRMAPGVCNLPGPERFHSGEAGAAVGCAPGAALGAALALKGTGKLPVATMGDGDFFAALPSLWTAAHYRIPSVWVINNNRSYFGDEDYQKNLALLRGRPPENAWLAQRLENPEADFAAIARDFGLAGEGPIRDPAELGPALDRAVAAAKRGQLALVDVRTENRAQAW